MHFTSVHLPTLPQLLTDSVPAAQNLAKVLEVLAKNTYGGQMWIVPYRSRSL